MLAFTSLRIGVQGMKVDQKTRDAAKLCSFIVGDDSSLTSVKVWLNKERKDLKLGEESEKQEVIEIVSVFPEFVGAGLRAGFHQ